MATATVAKGERFVFSKTWPMIAHTAVTLGGIASVFDHANIALPRPADSLLRGGPFGSVRVVPIVGPASDTRGRKHDRQKSVAGEIGLAASSTKPSVTGARTQCHCGTQSCLSARTSLDVGTLDAGML